MMTWVMTNIGLPEILHGDNANLNNSANATTTSPRTRRIIYAKDTDEFAVTSKDIMLYLSLMRFNSFMTDSQSSLEEKKMCKCQSKITHAPNEWATKICLITDHKEISDATTKRKKKSILAMYMRTCL